MKMREYEKKSFEEAKDRPAPASYEMIRWVRDNPMAAFAEFEKAFPDGRIEQYNYCMSLLD